MSRAEKFEDEKRRIMQSCFSRKDSDGTCMYTYLLRYFRLHYAIAMPRSSSLEPKAGNSLNHTLARELEAYAISTGGACLFLALLQLSDWIQGS